MPEALSIINARRYTGVIILCLNYERIWRIINVLQSVDWDMIIADESQRIKSPTSKQSKGMYDLGIGVPYKLLLSGTPMDEDEMDLFSQFRFLDDTILGSNYYKFRSISCSKRGYDWVLRPQAKTSIRKKTGRVSIRIKMKDMKDIPPTFDTEIQFDLTGKAKKLYYELEEGHYAKHEGLTSLSEMSAINQLRLQQLTGGFFHTKEGITVELEQDKLKAMCDFLYDVPRDRKLVIFVRFREEINIIREAMNYQGRTVDVLDGRTKDQGKCWIRFQDKPNPSCLIVQIRAGGVGIELFASSLCILYSINHSWIDYDQLRKRLDRNGQTRPVNFVKMIGKNSIDIDLYNSVDKKGRSVEGVLAEMKLRRIQQMAKSKTTKKDTKPAKVDKKKPTPPSIPKPDNGVAELATAMGIDAATVRVKLRAAGDAMKKKYKTGRAWDFGTAKNLKSVAKELKG